MRHELYTGAMVENNQTAVAVDPLLAPLVRRWIFPMVKRGPRFVLPLGKATRQAFVANGEYDADFLPFLERVCGALQSAVFPAGSYYPGGWYRALRAQGRDPAAEPVTPEALAPFQRPELRVDERGGWWSGEKAITGRVLRFFLAHLAFEPDLGLYCVRYPLEQIEEAQYVHAESPPFRVERLDAGSGRVRLVLNDGTVESLRPETLWLDAHDRLFCAAKFHVARRGIAVAIDDPARWDLLATLEETDGVWFVEIGGARRPIPVRA